jgi:hypothetical protein
MALCFGGGMNPIIIVWLPIVSIVRRQGVIGNGVVGSILWSTLDCLINCTHNLVRHRKVLH